MYNKPHKCVTSRHFSLFTRECVRVTFNSAPAVHLAGTHTAAVSGADAVCGAAAGRPASDAHAPPRASRPGRLEPPGCNLLPLTLSRNQPETVASAGLPATSSLSDSPAGGRRDDSVRKHMTDTQCTKNKEVDCGNCGRMFLLPNAEMNTGGQRNRN